MRRIRVTGPVVHYPVGATCPRVESHTPHPEGYLAHSEWAEKMLKTHRQVQCSECGLWTIWVPLDAEALRAQEGEGNGEQQVATV
jgi:hypothetical protein